MTTDWLAPTYICPNRDCEDRDVIIVASVTDPLCLACGGVLEEVEVEVIVDGDGDE